METALVSWRRTVLLGDGAEALHLKGGYKSLDGGKDLLGVLYPVHMRTEREKPFPQEEKSDRTFDNLSCNDLPDGLRIVAFEVFFSISTFLSLYRD